VYVRVSIDGIPLVVSNSTSSLLLHSNKISTTKKNKKKYGSVAVGDTFLFTSLSTRYNTTLMVSEQTLTSQKKSISTNKNEFLSSTEFLTSDVFCMTHILPYYRCFLGNNSEEMSVRRLLTCTKSPHLLVFIYLFIYFCFLCN
jgi:hypothetical protein